MLGRRWALDFMTGVLQKRRETHGHLQREDHTRRRSQGCSDVSTSSQTATTGAGTGQSPSAPPGEASPAHRWTSGPRNCEGGRRGPRKPVRKQEAVRGGDTGFRPFGTPQISHGTQPSPSHVLLLLASQPATPSCTPRTSGSLVPTPCWRGPRIPALPTGQTQDSPSAYEAP